MSVKAPLEADIQAACIDLLGILGGVVIRTNSGAMRVGKRLVRFNRTPGCSDVLACLGGRFLAVEVKRPGGKLTPDQGAFLDAVRRAGGVGIVVRSVSDLQAALAAEGFTGGER